jgi:hypothetical protein
LPAVRLPLGIPGKTPEKVRQQGPLRIAVLGKEGPEIHKNQKGGINQMAENTADDVWDGAAPVGGLERPKLDISPYVGKMAKIEKVELLKGAFGPYFKISTEPVAREVKDQNGKVIKDKNGAPIQVRASKVFGLFQDAEGKWGWDDESKLGLFLKQMKVKNPEQLFGKEVQCQKTAEKDGKQYLTFA